MSIQIIKNPWSQAFSGVGSALGSALQQRGQRASDLRKTASEREYQKGLTEEEREFQRIQKENERTRVSKYGGALEAVLAKTGTIDSVEKYQLAQAGLVKQGVPTAEATNLLAPSAGILLEQAKEKAKAGTEQDKLTAQYEHIANIFGPQTPTGDQQMQPPGEEGNEGAQGVPRTFTNSEGREFSQNDISRLMLDPNVGVREVGKSYQDQLNKRQMEYLGEQKDIRKENRERIHKHAEPFADLTTLRKNVNRLNEVERIIKNEEASYDQSTWRSVASALLDDTNRPHVADLIKTEPQKQLFSLLRPFFGTKEIGGSNPSTREVLFTLSTLPSGTKKKATNEYIAKLLKNEAETLLEQGKVINEIQDEDQTFSQYQKQIEERIAPFQQQKQQELVRLAEVQAAQAQIKYKKAKSGYVFVLTPDGEIREYKNDVAAQAVKNGGINLNEY